MKAQDFVLNQLKNCSNYELTNEDRKLIDSLGIEEYIFKKITSKKFRKYSIDEELKNWIKKAIHLNVSGNKPIQFVFPHGAYKLWRLNEAPYPDWAELFTAIYYTNWLKPICEVYKPGVCFDFFVDDLIVPIIDNIPSEDVQLYINEFQKILDFLKQYQPPNLKMTITPFETLFTSKNEFNEKLNKYTEDLKKTKPSFKEDSLTMVELNARPTRQQLADPKWREKILLVHDAYISMKRDIGYYSKPEKIPVFNQPLASVKFLALGTTKTSIVKFWVGVGVLKKDKDSFMEYILSPKQIAQYRFTEENVAIEGLNSKNFNKIKILTQ